MQSRKGAKRRWCGHTWNSLRIWYEYIPWKILNLFVLPPFITFFSSSCPAFCSRFLFNKRKWPHTALGVTSVSWFPFFPALQSFYNNECSFFIKPSLQLHPTPPPISLMPLSAATLAVASGGGASISGGDCVKFTVLFFPHAQLVESW